MSGDDQVTTARRPSVAGDAVSQAIDALVARHHHLAAELRGSDRLAAALAELGEATGWTGEDMARHIGERELASAKKPIDVLISRCRTAVSSDTQADREAPAAPESTTRTAPPPTAAAPAAASPSPVTWWQRTAGRGVVVTPPTVAGPAAQRVATPLIGNRCLAVVAATGGAGASTFAVVLGQVLATCRSDRVVVTDAAAVPGGVAARAGVSASGAIRALLADEPRVHGCTEVSRYVGRTSSRLDVAGLGLDDLPVNADEFRRASVLLSRFYDLLVADVGAAMSAEASLPAIGLADLVIVVAPSTVHGARSVDRRLRWLTDDAGVMPAQILVVVNGVHRRTPYPADRIAAGVAERCSSCTSIPWDPHLAAGEAIDLRRLHSRTLQAATAATAALVEGLAASAR